MPLYHGSAFPINSAYLEPARPGDKTRKENCMNAVYATDRKDIAIGMALTKQKYARSFADYSQRPFKVIFVRGEPKQNYVYVYKVSSKGFTEKPRGSHQWVSKQPANILSKEKFAVKDLKEYWRKATKKEKEWFYYE